MENKTPEVQIKINEESFKGAYSNAAIISHTQSEFLLDFISVFHGKGLLTSRVIVSPNQAKHVLRALGDNIANYEKNFGEIKEAADPGFKMETVN
jgi:hypothetical protein